MSDVGIREELLRRFVESGERERVQELLKSKLNANGWQDEVRQMCKDIIKEKEPNPVTVDELAGELTPRARASVPENVKAEMLEQIQAFLAKALPQLDQ
ncbi:Transcription and mRNA export factor eny2 [Mycoemilia scoparia]|uniref:Transcription and mRNA export factor SUS1 n=1 Tax=Mycoemilia scoparia TaxID=417184 RepID=A0A9W8A461_9FUNG|nr:Transcription and mRNA export factor eny2 [Mycoemilia scoparia]